ncbi:MAG: hypothetical protein Q8R47_04810 [Nanoarchaeota archaeon]|nr:hypothetical protein [Nanoarchaeota archaeon]
MRNYLAKAIANLHLQRIQLEYLQGNAAIPRDFIDYIRKATSKCDSKFTLAEIKAQESLPEYLRDDFSLLQEAVRFEHEPATYRLGIIDTGLRSDHYKPSGENLEALALMGMVVEANLGGGMNLGRSCCLTLLDEANIIISTKFIGKELVIINRFMPLGSANNYCYDSSNITSSKARLQEAHHAFGPEINQVMEELKLTEIAFFGFETILKSMQRQKMTN